MTDEVRESGMLHVLVLPSWYGTADLPWGGVFFKEQAEAIAAAGARVGVAFVERRSVRTVTPRKLLESHFQTTVTREGGIDVLRVRGWNTLPPATVAGGLLWSALTSRLVRRYVRLFGVPDVIHAHGALWGGHAGVGIAQALGRPCVVTEHASNILRGPLSASHLRHAGEVYRQADHVCAVSGALLTSVREISGRPVGEVVPNGVDFGFFSLPSFPRRESPYTFLSVGNLVPGKRIDLLLRAFAIVAAARPDVRLVIGGGGPEAAHLKRLAQELGVAHCVEFTGPISRVEVRDRMWAANCFVLASDFETFGVVLVEALATGLSVIATRCGGPEEVITPGTGVLVDRGNVSQLAEAMLSAPARRHVEERLREASAHRYDSAVVARRMIECYRRLSIA